MIHDWPAELPRPERQTWQLQRPDARRKSQSDAGPPRYRRRFSSVPQMVTLSVLLSRQERQVFDTFFVATGYGSELFRMPDPTTDGWRMLASDGLPILTGDGAPVLLAATWLCSFGDSPPSEGIVGREFRKTFSVVVIP